MTQIQGLFSERERFRVLDAPFTGSRAVDEERDGAALGDATAVIRELHANLK